MLIVWSRFRAVTMWCNDNCILLRKPRKNGAHWLLSCTWWNGLWNGDCGWIAFTLPRDVITPYIMWYRQFEMMDFPLILFTAALGLTVVIVLCFYSFRITPQVNHLLFVSVCKLCYRMAHFLAVSLVLSRPLANFCKGRSCQIAWELWIITGAR